MKPSFRSPSIFLAAMALCGAAAAQSPTQPAPKLAQGEALSPWAGADYDPAVPSLASVLGYRPGEEITTSADAVRYLEALAAFAPDRMRIVRYGKSWQGRELVYAVIAAPETMARLGAIQADIARIRDPRGLAPAEARRIVVETPAVTWLAYSVHGDEIGPGDAALQTAYHLLAARGDARVGAILKNTIAVIAPVQNPDGRDRFIASNRSARGLSVDGDPLAAERDQPWPAGRFNHALFDLNRDWFAQTQPETRAHARAVLDWMPTVLADIHEMGSDRSYFFPPAAPPTNPLQTAEQMRMREEIGRNHGRWFDQLGLGYFTREDYDLFYPGYGDGWPSYHGAVAMTYEQGSARGLAARRSDGGRFTFADTILSQLAASLSTLEVAATNRQRLVGDLLAYRQSAITEAGRSGARAFVIPPQADQHGADRLARLLASQGVEVKQAGAGARCGAALQAGAYVVDAAQPAGRLARVLLEPRIDIEKAFLAEQERRRARGLPDQIYDLTAWSLPKLFNVRVEACKAAPSGALTPVSPDPLPGTLTNPEAKLGFLAPWGEASAARLLAGALQAGLKARSADAAFTHAGERRPAGTLFFPRADNPENLAETLGRLARESGARVIGVDDGWVSDGPNFGSDRMPTMPAPRVAMAWDAPTSATAAGATRHVVERELGYPVTAIRASRLARADLSAFDVLILPEADDYGRVLGEGGAKRIKDWVSRGGVLIALGGATRWLADPKTDFVSMRREDAYSKEAEKEGKDNEETTVPGALLESAEDFAAATAPTRTAPDSVAGVLVRAQVDADHWLAAGVAAEVFVLLSGSDIYTPVRRDEGWNVARFDAADSLLASGYLWEQNRKQLAFKPFVVAEPEGRGQVIAFTADPTARGFHHGLHVFLANAIFRGAAHADPVRR